MTFKFSWSACSKHSGLNHLSKQRTFLTKPESKYKLSDGNKLNFMIKITVNSFHTDQHLYLAGFGHSKAASEQQYDIPGNRLLSFLPG